MSHYAPPHTDGQLPRARVAFFGGTLVAVGLFGFYAFLQKKHERKHAHDRLSTDQARISSWEYRMLARGRPTPDSESAAAALRTARVEAPGTPTSPPVSNHNARHRTFAEDAAAAQAQNATATLSPASAVSDESGRDNGRASLEQPTAQRGFSDGREGVYTKNPGWREQAHYATETSSSESRKENQNGNGNGAVDSGGKAKMEESARGVEEKVKSFFGGRK